MDRNCPLCKNQLKWKLLLRRQCPKCGNVLELNRHENEFKVEKFRKMVVDPLMLIFILIMFTGDILFPKSIIKFFFYVYGLCILISFSITVCNYLKIPIGWPRYIIAKKENVRET
jgi:hypothetical protein